MLSEHTELILGIVIAIVGYNTLSTIGLKEQLSDVKRINTNLLKANKKLNEKNSIWRIEAPKILRVGELNANNIRDLSDQQQLLNKFVGEVLNVSNLIPSKELGIETIHIIEELRQRVQWAEEVEKHQVNDSDFYTGD